jgi:TolB-like protein/class 3 adenylate cyclase
MERKLAAIFSTNVKGYSRLMGDDEMATIHTITAYREVMTSLIQQHRGRVVDSPGDNLLAEFPSVVEAVQCAVAIQQELKARNAELPPHRRMEFRIGINLGDVIADGDRLYGDGVNIAARLEGLAEGGGLCISGTVYDQVKTRLPLDYEELGAQAVKNIAEPVRVYRVHLEPGARAPTRQQPTRPAAMTWWRGALTVVGLLLLLGGGVAVWQRVFRPPSPTGVVPATETPTLAPPDKPSIAVLPFANLSGDPTQEYFSDGMTEDLITDLSKLSGLFVIARNSVFTYKGQAVKPQQVSQELGVRYVLEGSVRKAGERVRITAQLVEAMTGYQRWAERYDRDLKDIFAVQEEMAWKIVAALAVQLTGGEKARLRRKDTDNLEAYDYYLRGEDFFHLYKQSLSQEANAQAQQMFERAITLDPKFAAAHAAWMHPLFLRHGVTTVRDVGNNLDVILIHRRRSQKLGQTRPRLFACGPIIDWPGLPQGAAGSRRVVLTTDEARAAARDLLERQVDCLKVSDKLTPPVVQAIVETAAPHGVPVTAQLRATTAAEAAALGVKGVESASGVDYAVVTVQGLQELARLLAAKGVFVAPTLVVNEQLARLLDPSLRQEPLLRYVPLAQFGWWDAPYGVRTWTEAHAAEH